MVDAIAPFFVGYDVERINWSKIPFENLEIDGRFDEEKFYSILPHFRRYLDRVQALGFNAITLDDLAHVVDCNIYSPDLREKVHSYRTAYHQLFSEAHIRSLHSYLTSDVMFFNQDIEDVLLGNRKKIIQFMRYAVEQVFIEFPQLSGVVLRIGESDGVDVSGDFVSRLVLKRPDDARALLEVLLPVFEAYQKNLIFRLWSVGSYPLGDLLWNRLTFDKVFGNIESKHLILSIKYGESDFYRFLPLNKLFFRSNHRKIIELQARREYEGFGEYPSFIGWDYEQYALQLPHAKNVVGCSVWCQTGGWTHFRRLTFLEQSAKWNELNAYVAIKIFKEGWSTEQAIEQYSRTALGRSDWEKLSRFLRLSDEVIKELLYVRDFSGRKIFFRRLRVPPMLWVFWDHVFINHFMRKLLRLFVEDADYTVDEGYFALEKIKVMQEIAKEIGLPYEDLAFQYDTFEILAAARKYYLLPFSEETVHTLQTLSERYAARYNHGYRVEMDFSPARLKSRHLRVIVDILCRDKRGYRVLDQVLTLRGLKVIYPFTLRRWKRWFPSFFDRQAMGIDSIFR